MENNKLFSEFPEVSTKEWEEVIAKDLKGADYEKKLVWKTLEGFNVRPYYRAEDLATLEYLNGNPGQSPFVRGYKKITNAWDIRQDVMECDIATANAIALAGLKRGVTSLGLMAKKVKTAADMKALLKGIDLSAIKINFIKSEDYLQTIKLFIDEVKAQNIDGKKVQGSINFDPYTCALKTGEFCGGGLEKRYDEFVEIMNLVRENIPAFDVVTVNGSVFNNAGAAIVQELAYTLSAANEYMYNLTQRGIAPHSVGYRMVFSFAVGSNYFMEIAKLRAARLLWTKIVEQYNPKCPTAYELHIHTENSFYNKTIYDPYVNMLRTTTETMSAAIAGADSISVYPFDVTLKKADEFSTRIATNQQILLKEESYMDKVVDPAAGSYYIENLTNALAEKAWEIFKEIEAKGGFVEAIKAGIIQDAIAATAAKRAKDVATRKTTILGTNQYPNLNEPKPKLEKKECCACKAKGNDIKTLPCNRLAEPFEALRMESENAAKTPKVFLLTYGNLAMRKARAQFSTNFFGVAAYQILDNAGFATPEEGAKAAVESGADVVVLCSSDDEYPELVSGTLPTLKQHFKHIVVAGNPVDNMESFNAQGVTDYINVKTNALESLIKYNKALL